MTMRPICELINPIAPIAPSQRILESFDRFTTQESRTGVFPCGCSIVVTDSGRKYRDLGDKILFDAPTAANVEEAAQDLALLCKKKNWLVAIQIGDFDADAAEPPTDKPNLFKPYKPTQSDEIFFAAFQSREMIWDRMRDGSWGFCALLAKKTLAKATIMAASGRSKAVAERLASKVCRFASKGARERLTEEQMRRLSHWKWPVPSVCVMYMATHSVILSHLDEFL